MQKFQWIWSENKKPGQMKDRDTLLSTSSLFHYTYSKKNLSNILKEGFKPKYFLEKSGILKQDDVLKSNLKALGINNNDELAIPMCCFCDIPLNLVKNHTKVYGNYAVGLTKNWGIKKGISPVFYFVDGMTRDLFKLLVIISHRLRPIIEKKISINSEQHSDLNMLLDINYLIKAVYNLVDFAKPYISKYKRKRMNFEDNNYKFYDEREWRYRPQNFPYEIPILYKEHYKNKETIKKHDDKLNNIIFDQKDITHIIVPKEEIDYFKKKIIQINRLKNIDPDLIVSLP